jgi:DNA polymerase-4
MPLRTAAALCPDGVFLPVDGAKYARESRRVMEILGRFTPLLEQVSIDEAFLDVAGSEALFGPPEAIALRIKAVVRAEVGLTASVGVATTKLVAKVASDLRKPDGLVVVPPGDEAAFLAPLPIRRLWGVGARTHTVLSEHGVHTIGELAQVPVDVLVRRLGAHGASLHERAQGIDDSPVTGDIAAKSVSHEHTFDVDTADPEVIERTLLALAEGVAARLRAGAVRAATVQVKVRDSAFHTVTRQRTLAQPTDLADPIFRTALDLVRPEARGRRVRLLGVGAHGLGEPAQMGLFETEDPRRRKAVEAQDEIRRRFGSRALTRARLLGDPLADPGGRDPMQPLQGRRVGRGRPEAGAGPTESDQASGARPGDGDTDAPNRGSASGR